MCDHAVSTATLDWRTGDGGGTFIWWEIVGIIISHPSDGWDCPWGNIPCGPSMEAWCLFQSMFGRRNMSVHNRWGIGDAWNSDDR